MKRALCVYGACLSVCVMYVCRVFIVCVCLSVCLSVWCMHVWCVRMSVCVVRVSVWCVSVCVCLSVWCVCMQDIIECRKYLRVLNGKTATATALILFNLGSAGIVGILTHAYTQVPVPTCHMTYMSHDLFSPWHTHPPPPQP